MPSDSPTDRLRQTRPLTDLNDFYAAFEERHRGTFDNIKARVLHYLPEIKDQNIALQGLRALDLGCGRGDWLESLGENGINALGTDQNLRVVDIARKRGPVVEVSDIFEAMARLDGKQR